MKMIKFRCLGVLNENHKIFHSRNDGECFVDYSGCITLFGKEYSFETALINDSDVLFNYCRKYFLRLYDESKKRGMHVVTNDLNSRLRMGITSFLNYIFRFLQTCIISDDFLKSLVKQLSSLRIMFHKLSLAKLPNHSLVSYASSFGVNSSSPSFELVHCHLDFRWLFINIIQALGQAKKNSNVEIPNDLEMMTLCVEEEILRLMNELMWVSIIRFEKAEPSELAQHSAFPCICVKELWFLLMHYEFKNQDFWEYFRQTLKIVLEKKSAPEKVLPASLQMTAIDYLPCKDRNVFALWFLSDVIQLIKYDAEGKLYIKGPSFKVDKFEVVDDVIRGVLFDDGDPSESTLRNLLPLVYKIQSACQHIPSRPITHLWEFFFKKIHSSFYIPGSKLNSGLALSKTGADLLNDVKTRLSDTSFDKHESSFLMFLHLLGSHLKANYKESSNRLLSRIFLKFPTAKSEKLSEFREQGIYHLSSLFLTLAISSGNATAVKRLVEILSAIPRSDTMKEGKHEMIWKSYAASLIALQEMRANLSDSLQIILKHVDWCLKELQIAPLAHFIDGLAVVAQGDIHETVGIVQIIGQWITNYLSMCRPREIEKLFSVLTPIVYKIEPYGGSSEIQAARLKIEQFIIPNLYGSGVGAELAAVCAITCASSRMKLISDWTNRNDCESSGKFLAVLLDKCSPALGQNLKLESCLQMVWMRCCFLRETTETTKLLSQHFNKYCRNGSFVCNVDLPFVSFVNFYEMEFSCCHTLADKSRLRTSFAAFFPKFDQWLPSQFKTVEAINEETSEDVYKHTAELFSKCPCLIYTRSDPHCLLKILIDVLILPHQIFKKDYRHPKHVFSAISEHMSKIIEGLLFLDPDRDPYIGRLVRDVITHYLPRFSTIPVEYHPFLTILSDSFVMKILQQYLSTPNVHPDANSVLSLLRAIVSDSSPSSILVFNDTSDLVLEKMIQLMDGHPLRRSCFAYFSTALESPIHRKRMVNLLSESLTKNIRMKSTAWLDVVKKLAPLCGTDLSPLLPLATETIKEYEKSVKKENDPHLRQVISTLEIIIG